MTWEKDTSKFDSNACVSASKQKLIKASSICFRLKHNFCSIFISSWYQKITILNKQCHYKLFLIQNIRFFIQITFFKKVREIERHLLVRSLNTLDFLSKWLENGRKILRSQSLMITIYTMVMMPIKTFFW